MAEIHRTTLEPTKVQLLTGWLPQQPWYRGQGRPPELTRAGGFRLDDPAGEVGIEFLFVLDRASRQDGGDAASTGDGDGITYHVPLSYRGAPLAGAEEALVGTAEHGVLGRRWIYDGVHDPVVVAQLLALVAGEAAPQHQRVSNTADPSVTASWNDPQRPPVAERLAVHVVRVPEPDGGPAGGGTGPSAPAGHVEADVPQPDGTTARCRVLLFRESDAPAGRSAAM